MKKNKWHAHCENLFKSIRFWFDKNILRILIYNIIIIVIKYISWWKCKTTEKAKELKVMSYADGCLHEEIKMKTFETCSRLNCWKRQ